MVRSLLVKTIKGESFRIDVPEESSMSEVKAKIAEVRGDDPSSQVLICSGRTLKDDDSLSSSVATSGFLVLMVKPKRRATSVAPAGVTPAAPSAAAAAPAPAMIAASATSGATPPADSPSPAAGATPAAAAAATPVPASTPAPAPAAAGAAAAPAGTEAGGGGGGGEGMEVDPASVEMLTAMGFPEDQARVALRAAFNDVSRAASYLMEGIPDDVQSGAGSDARGGDGALAAVMAGGDGDSRAVELAEALAEMQGEDQGGNPLNFMRFHPQFDQLRGLVRENPAMLPQVLQGLASQSPELIERINEHPDDFLRLMNEPPDAVGQAMMEMGGVRAGDTVWGQQRLDSPPASTVSPTTQGHGPDPSSARFTSNLGRGRFLTVELTEEEDAAVANLIAMVPGVGRDQVIEAFIACDKNAEMAANLLFENAM
ncbi:unnamed protein product [Scytosiphon promiscuus]